MEEHRYATVEDDTIVNVAVCDDPDHAAAQGWLDIEDLDPLPWIGWTLVDGTWTPPPPLPGVEPL